MYTNYENSYDGGSIAAGLIFSIIGYVLTAWFMGKVFKKAGIAPWRAWVPIYNNWVFLELGGFKGYLILLGLFAWIPFLGIVATIALIVVMLLAAYRIGAGFDKGPWWTVLYFFFPVIWLGILAFGSDYYNPEEARSNGGNPDIYPQDKISSVSNQKYGY